jgi:hypothetical protein
MPTLARTQQRFTTGHTPTQEYSRFRWSNSCESAQTRIAVTRAVTVVRADFDFPPERPVPRWQRTRDDVLLPQSVSVHPAALRAPPVHTL